MTKQRLQKLIHKAERGQAVILIAFAIIGLVAMVGLVTDTGILLIEYGKLKRGVDAAAVAAAQQYRLRGNVLDQAALENAAKNFLQLNQSTDILEDSVIVHSCESPEADRPVLCNPDPDGHPNDNRKLVEVIATKNVYFGFLRVIGINSTTVTANAVGEAATIDLVLVIDTSAAMAFETDTDPSKNDLRSDSSLEDPSVCNYSVDHPCQPLRAVKDVALDFIDTLYFPYDRVSIIALTSQNPNGNRNPIEVLPLTSDRDDIVAHIDDLRVFEPINCDDGSYEEGTCLKYVDGNFTAAICGNYELNPTTADPSPCPSSNVGGALKLARSAFIDPTDPDFARLDAFWVVVNLLGGPANATNPDDEGDYPNGFCPPYTFYWDGPWCRDKRPSVRHSDTDPLVSYTYNGVTSDISYYDADDYARDMADDLATLISGEGVTIFTIGLGAPVRSTTTVEAGEEPAAEALLKYIAECAGEGSPNDCATTVPAPAINHGQYFYAPNSDALTDIFDRIAKNIATKISQ